MDRSRLEFEITVSDRDDGASEISEHLRLYIEEKFAPANRKPFVAIARGPEGEVVGGLTGFFHWRWLYIQQLWVAELARSRGLGRKLLLAAEEKAKESASLGLYVDTFEEKNRDFYFASGFEQVGVISNFPREGASRYFLAKPLK